jgi:hypothetical protein
VLDVTSDTDIGEYVVLRARSGDERTILTGSLRGGYWFPDKQVRRGDLVVLYTKAGNSREKRNSDGSQTHFFYWGRTTACWGDEQTAGVYAAFALGTHSIQATNDHALTRYCNIVLCA